MGIAIRQPGQEYFANGMFQNLNVKFRQERGFYLDWDIELRWFNTDAHDLHERIAERTDCVSFTDFMFLFKQSFSFLLRSMRERPEKNQSYVVSFRNRNLRYVITYGGARYEQQTWIFKTIRDSAWKMHPQDKQFILAM